MTFVEMVKQELVRARNGNAPMANLMEAYAVTLEEIMELWDIVRMKSSQRSRTDTLEELVQIGAMAQRSAEDCNVMLGLMAFPDLVEVGLAKMRAGHRLPINSLHEGWGYLWRDAQVLLSLVNGRLDEVRVQLVQIAAMAQRTAEDLGLLDTLIDTTRTTS